MRWNEAGPRCLTEPHLPPAHCHPGSVTLGASPNSPEHQGPCLPLEGLL